MTVKGYVTMRLILTACLSLLCTFGTARPGAAELSTAEVKQLALEAILENPEIIRQAIDLLRQNDKAAAAVKSQALLQNERARLERDPNAPLLGNLDGDVTIVEFFDQSGTNLLIAAISSSVTSCNALKASTVPYGIAKVVVPIPKALFKPIALRG